MASTGPIEELYVSIEADTSALLKESDKAIRQVEGRLGDLDKAGKKAGRFQQLKNGLKNLARQLTSVKIAVIALGAALVAAFRMAQEAISQLRIERSFYSLAAAANQSGNDILDAMQRASRGAVDDLTLMQKANLALQLGVAKTPEEFEKLTQSAIALGAAVGRGPVEALDDLIVAAGRRSRLVLDNLGLSLGEVNRLMDQFAQEEFGKTVDQLSQIQRDMLFTRATIEAANQKAAQLGGNLEDAGTNVERMNAQWKNLRGELNKTTLILISLLNKTGEGPGLLERLTAGAKSWQGILIQVSAILMAINDTLQGIGVRFKDITDALKPETLLPGGEGALRKLLGGEKLTVEDLTPGFLKIPQRIGETIGEGLKSGDLRGAAEEAGDSIGETFTESLTRHLTDLETQFQDVLDPEAAAAGAGGLPGPVIDEEPTDESAEKVKGILDDLTTDMIEATESRQETLEKLEEDHAKRMADIAEEGAQARLEIDRELQADLAELAQETAQQRAEIMTDAERELADLAEDTDRKLADERDDFQTEERRDTEDHLRDMRRLTEDYLFQLEDAVKERDARAVVDLQRRFNQEQQRREEDFTTRQGREREDASEQLAEIRENEARRRQEILDQRAQQLQDLMNDEAMRRAEIERNHQEQIQRLEENLARQRQDQLASYQERQADLNGALAERLQAIATELADEENVNEQGARRILGVLNKYFGAGGDVDQLMEDFAARRRQRMTIQIAFEEAGEATAASMGTRGRRPRARHSFQHGGAMIARQPTTALFGEAGPELAQFIPLGRGQGGIEMPPQRMEIEFSGTAPPGIRSAERDQIAGVILNALRETGQVGR